ncbi:MAG: amino acid permease [Sedimentisphaerales bacterium]|nr:amino acid permease [Sedimentisphaerales bacterium]
MQLHKVLTLLDVFCISTGAMLSGLFLLPGLAYAQAGPAVLACFFLAGLLALAGLLSQAELASAMPKAGGTYFYVTRSMGPGIGTVYGLITWLAMLLKSSYELLFLAAFLQLLWRINLHAIAIGLCVVFLAINLVGVKKAGRLQKYSAIALLLLLLSFCVRAYPMMDAGNFKPFAPAGLDGLLTTAGFVFIGYGGLLKVASMAEEVKNPGRALPVGMIGSWAFVTVLYAAVVFAAVAVLGPDLSDSRTPLTDAASAFWGAPGRIVLSLGAALAVVTAANAGIMAASRYPLALARDEMLPAVFARINSVFRTPHYSILLTGLVMIAVLFLDVVVLVKAASSVLILTYMFTCLAGIVLRESQVQNYQPRFRAPGYPWVQLVGLVGFTVLLWQLGTTALLITLVFVVLGFLVYWFYGRKKTRQEYALLHLIERITARELTSHSLETELKNIIHERDEIFKDRFDHLVEACPVLDIAGAVSREEFFRQTARELADRLDLPAERIVELLCRRENESSTVLNSFLAIPHIVVEGSHRFEIVLARSKGGIEFSEKAPAVNTVFVLIGSPDERQFHLTALAAICQIVQDKEFAKRWREAKKIESLRDVVLLGKRQRYE